MKFESNVLAYLSGEKFSNGLRIKCKRDNILLDRVGLIEKLVTGKNVLHVGCTDHIPLIKEKMERGTWLHARLEKVTKRLVGLDLNSEAIEYIKNLGVEQVYATNIVSDDVLGFVKDEKWDYMILGEIVEHVDNPVEFLMEIGRKYSAHVERMIVTVPNALRYANIISTLQGVELINTDHRYWFTPYTMAKVANRAGLSVTEYYLVDAFMSRRPWSKFRQKKFPLTNDTLVMILRFGNG